MSSSFRRPFVVIRMMPGEYVRGEWVEGASTEVGIMASVQPTTGRDLEALPEGNRSSSTVKIYTDDRLKTTDPQGQQQPDLIVYMGDRYKVICEAPNQSGVINHFKYLAELVKD